MILHLTVKREWFDKIVSGEKIIEYREVKKYWETRLRHKNGKFKNFDTVHFRNGYGKNVPVCVVEFICTLLEHGMRTDLKINKAVFAIHLGVVLYHTKQGAKLMEKDYTGILISKINNRKLRRKDIATVYRKAILSSGSFDFRKVNLLIIERWSFSGLKFIKDLAWKGI